MQGDVIASKKGNERTLIFISGVVYWFHWQQKSILIPKLWTRCLISSAILTLPPSPLLSSNCHQIFLSFRIKICLNMFPDFFRYLDSLYRAFHTAVNSAISSRPHDWAHLPSHFTATKYSPSDVTNQTYPSRPNTYHLMWPMYLQTYPSKPNTHTIIHPNISFF